MSSTAPVIYPYGPNTNDEGRTSLLLSYAQGDDYVRGQAAAPGQAASVNLERTNTTCAGNVATTVIPRNANTPVAPAGARGIVALQGKWKLPVPAGFADSAEWTFPVMFVRVPTPTYEFVVGTGAPATTMYVRVPTPTYEFVVGTGAAATPRRAIADTAECLGCHVGLASACNKGRTGMLPRTAMPSLQSPTRMKLRFPNLPPAIDS